MAGYGGPRRSEEQTWPILDKVTNVHALVKISQMSIMVSVDIGYRSSQAKMGIFEERAGQA